MKLSIGIHAIAEKCDDFKAIDMVKKAGFEAIDFSFHGKAKAERVLGDGYREYAQKVRAYLDEVGIVCTQAHAPYSIRYEMEKELFEQEILQITRAIEAAAVLGAKNIVVHPIITPRGVDFEEYNLKFYKRFIPCCEKHGIRIAVENIFNNDTKRRTYSSVLGRPEELNRMIDRLDSPCFVACIDIGHAALTGYEPEDFIGGVKAEYVKALHVQDNFYVEDVHTLPYCGKLDWAEIMIALKKCNYDGDLTYEIGKYIRKMPDTVLPEAINLAAAVGRHLISIFNQ